MEILWSYANKMFNALGILFGVSRTVAIIRKKLDLQYGCTQEICSWMQSLLEAWREKGLKPMRQCLRYIERTPSIRHLIHSGWETWVICGILFRNDIQELDVLILYFHNHRFLTLIHTTWDSLWYVLSFHWKKKGMQPNFNCFYTEWW